MQSSKGTRPSSTPPVIAIIGCGAIAESFHLPALARHPAVRQRLILVDRNIERVKVLATRYGVEVFCRDYQEILKRIDGAVIAVPHHLHYAIALDCVRNGVHVLCEKPLVESIAQLNEIVAEAERAGVRVAVNNNRRLFPSFGKVQQLIASGEIGATQYLEIYHGEQFDWPSATPSYFGAHSSGKGVLLDTGAHVLDLVCWWLGGKPRLISYTDDSLGGAEAVASLSFEHGACQVEVHLSWLSKLKNVYRVHGEFATIEVGIYDWRSVRVMPRNGKAIIIRTNSTMHKFSDLATIVLDNFLAVIRDGQEPLVTAHDVAGSIELIEECYRARSRFHMPWHNTLERITGGF